MAEGAGFTVGFDGTRTESGTLEKAGVGLGREWRRGSCGECLGASGLQVRIWELGSYERIFPGAFSLFGIGVCIRLSGLP